LCGGGSDADARSSDRHSRPPNSNPGANEFTDEDLRNPVLNAGDAADHAGDAADVSSYDHRDANGDNHDPCSLYSVY
jgi:hypothetical protein